MWSDSVLNAYKIVLNFRKKINLFVETNLNCSILFRSTKFQIHKLKFFNKNTKGETTF